jgi:nucleoid-associated protein YgaU
MLCTQSVVRKLENPFDSPSPEADNGGRGARLAERAAVSLQTPAGYELTQGTRALMGKLEKVIVLSVLALIAVILVISLSLDDPLKKEKAVWAGTPPGKPALGEAAKAAEAKDAGARPPTAAQLAAADKTAADVGHASPDAAAKAADSAQLASAARPLDANTGNAGAAPPSALLSTNVAPAQADGAPPAIPPAIPNGSILKSVDGLQDSYSPDLRFYTWQSGDSFRSVAAKYYGDAARFTLLRRTNEGRDNVQAGEKILVPVFDLDGAHGAATAAAPPAAKGDAIAKPDASKSAAAKLADASTGPRVHVVKDGESLWKIAKLELGDGGRWNEIYEANRDVLSKPEAVHAGLKLRIPVK